MAAFRHLLLCLLVSNVVVSASFLNHRSQVVTIRGSRVQEIDTDFNPGAGIVDKHPFEPFKLKLKCSFNEVGCFSDYLYHHGDKYGPNRHAYSMKVDASIVHYDDYVASEDRQAMTPEVCFKFCLTVPEMAFFGLVAGKTCYCAPYYQPDATTSPVCTDMCEGNPGRSCGGSGSSDIFSMFACQDRMPGHSLAQPQADAAAMTSRMLGGLSVQADTEATEAAALADDAVGTANEFKIQATEAGAFTMKLAKNVEVAEPGAVEEATDAFEDQQDVQEQKEKEAMQAQMNADQLVAMAAAAEEEKAHAAALALEAKEAAELAKQEAAAEPPSPADITFYCANACRTDGYCCNDPTKGSNQFLSCSQSCFAKLASGSALPASKCRTDCQAQAKKRGCRATLGKESFSMCSSCKDLTHSLADSNKCRWGVGDGKACIAGCDFAEKKAGATPASLAAEIQKSLQQAQQQVVGKVAFPADITAYCAEECGNDGYCCNNPKKGSNQFLSCSQACHAKLSSGAALSTAKCKTDCRAQAKKRGCRATLGTESYSMCSSCNDMKHPLADKAKCNWGVTNGDACLAGCEVAGKVEEPKAAPPGTYTKTAKHFVRWAKCPQKGETSCGSGKSEEQCAAVAQAACDKKPKCGAVAVRIVPKSTSFMTFEDAGCITQHKYSDRHWNLYRKEA